GNLLVPDAEVEALVDDEAVDLGERPLVEQQFEPLARGLLARLVLALDPLDTAAELGRAIPRVELVETILEGHGLRLLYWGVRRPSRQARSIATGRPESQ